MRKSNKLSASKVFKREVAGHVWRWRWPVAASKRNSGRGLSKAWIFRYMFAGRARYMGLGPLGGQVPLAKARARAEEARDLIYAGADPLEDRRKRRDDARNQCADRLIFKEAAGRFLDLHRDNWKNAKHKQQWENTLRDYAYPTRDSTDRCN